MTSTTASGSFSNTGYVYFWVNVYELSTSGNSSTVRMDAYCRYTGAGGSYSASSGGGSVSANIAGTGGGPWSVGSQYSNTKNQDMLVLAGFDVGVSHNTDGSGTASFSASISMGGWGTASASGTLTLTDFVRVPTTPSFSSGPSRSGTTANMSLSGVTNYGSSLKYYVDYSQNGGAYTGQQNSTGTSFSFPNLSLGSSYVFRGYAADTEGTGGTVASGSLAIPNVPGIPGPVSASTPSGRAVTVTTGAAVNNGASVDAYYAQASSDNGTTWGSDTAMTLSGSMYSVAFTGLTGGKTYAFRVRAHNEMGYGSYSSAVANVFVPSGGKRYDGTSFVNASIASRRNEANTAWVPMTITKKYVNGAWTDFV